ncbi:MAG: 50S ribosomal protein L21e [archaeon]
MVKRIGGFRKKSRGIMRKPRGTRGKISLRKYLQEFSAGETVYLKFEPAVQQGMFHPRFSGRAGVITKKLGTCYEVAVNHMGKEKKLIVHPIHLIRKEEKK